MTLHQQRLSVPAALRKLLDMLRPLLEIALAHDVDDDSAHRAGIRRFFLQPQSAYTLDELAELWRVAVADVREVFADEIGACVDANPDTFRVLWEEARRTGVAHNFFRPIDVERALGSNFESVRMESWRTVPLIVHVPRFMVDVLTSDEVMSFSNRTTSARIEQYLFDLFPGSYHEEFAAALDERGIRRNTATAERR